MCRRASWVSRYPRRISSPVRINPVRESNNCQAQPRNNRGKWFRFRRSNPVHELSYPKTPTCFSNKQEQPLDGVILTVLSAEFRPGPPPGMTRTHSREGRCPRQRVASDKSKTQRNRSNERAEETTRVAEGCAPSSSADREVCLPT